MSFYIIFKNSNRTIKYFYIFPIHSHNYHLMYGDYLESYKELSLMHKYFY